MSQHPDVYLTAPRRTPIGRFGGRLSALTAPELGVHAVKAVLATASVAADQVDQLIFGHARQAGTGPNPARQILYAAGIPETKPAHTVNKACGSGMQAIVEACQNIQLGEAECVVAGGTESMSNTPYLLPALRWGQKMGDTELVDGMYRDGFLCRLCNLIMGETAEKLARQYSIGRQEQDRYAALSQNRCQQAREEGRFEAEIAPIPIATTRGDIEIRADEHPRDGVTPDSLAKLPPVFAEDGSIHAGNSSGITDGAAAALVCSKAVLSALPADPPACRIVGYCSAGVDPSMMGIGPVPAVNRLLTKTGRTLEEIGLVELNEAFAAQVLACLRDLPIDQERLNVNGGAIALGHPIGCTGARIIVTLMHEMHQRQTRYGLATLCISGGMGMAMLLENARL